MFCPDCGARIEEDARFCSDCGAKLAITSDQVARPQLEGPSTAAQAYTVSSSGVSPQSPGQQPVINVIQQVQTPVPTAIAINQKNPAVALFLSLFIPGLGQIYNGQAGKGILMFFFCGLLWFMFLGWIINIWSMIDAYSSANAINSRVVYVGGGGQIAGR